MANRPLTPKELKAMFAAEDESRTLRQSSPPMEREPFFNDADPRHGGYGHICWEGCEAMSEKREPFGDDECEDIAASLGLRGVTPTDCALIRAGAKRALEMAAEVARKTVGGYTANIRTDLSEQELVPDKDGPWVLNSDVADRILALAAGLERKEGA